MDYVLSSIDWEFLISAVVGGLIAGACVLTAVIIQHNNELALAARKEEALIRGFIYSAITEIQVLWEAYQIGAGKKLEVLEKGKPFLQLYPITQDYFSVYGANAFLVGRIPDPKLRKAIVETYTRARWLIDSYQRNNDMVQRLHHLDLMRQDSENPGLIHMIWTQEQELIKYAPRLLELHRQTKISIEHLFLIVRKKDLPQP